MTKKIFCTDLDDTLLAADKSITPDTIQLLKDISAAGHYILLNSGRATSSVAYVGKSIGIPMENLYYCGYNGGEMIEAATGKTLLSRTMNLNDISYFLSYCHERDIACQTYDRDAVLVSRLTREIQEYCSYTGLNYRLVDDITTVVPGAPFKCLALCLDNDGTLDRLREELLPWAADRVALIRTSPMLLEAFSAASGKDGALTTLADMLGVDMKDTLAAGDQLNDIAMIEAAGLGVAMLNGVEELKAAADHITRYDNDHDGLVDVVREFFGV